MRVLRILEELKKVVKDPELSREITTLEERTLRKHRRQLNGLSIHVVVFRPFKRHEHMAKPLAFEELQKCCYKGSWRKFITKWEMCMEHHSQAGGLSKDDATMVYVLFKRQFLKMHEMSGHQAKFERSLPGSETHTFKWLLRCCKNVLEAERLESTASAWLEGTKPGAVNPVTLGLGEDKGKGGADGKGKGKCKDELNDVACPRAVSDQPCKFHDSGTCYYSHDKRKVEQGKQNTASAKGKAKAKPKAKGGAKDKGKDKEQARDVSKIQCKLEIGWRVQKLKRLQVFTYRRAECYGSRWFSPWTSSCINRLLLHCSIQNGWQRCLRGFSYGNVQGA